CVARRARDRGEVVDPPGGLVPVSDDEVGGQDLVDAAHVGGPQGQAPGQDRFEEALGELTPAAVPRGGQQQGGHRAPVQVLDFSDGADSDEGDVGPAGGAGPFSGDQVAVAVGGRCDEPGEGLVAVVLVAGVDQGQVPPEQ